MERTERFYKIQNLLRSRHFVSTQDFLSELGISRATFKRDLEYLRDRMRAPIAYDRDQQAYGFDPAIADSQLWQLPGLWFSADELQALLTMDRLLGDLQPGVLSELIAPLRKRLRSLLESGEHSAADIARRIKILSMGSRRVAPAHFRTIATAVLTRKRLKLRHQRRQDGEVIDREVSPQRLVHYRDNWYVDAWCHLRKGFRSFGVDAIEEVEILNEPALEVDAADQARAHHHHQERSPLSIAAAQGGPLVALVHPRHNPERVRVLRKVATRDPSHRIERSADRHVHAVVAPRREEDHRVHAAVVLREVEIVEPTVDHSIDAESLLLDHERAVEIEAA